ncbi:hypothetical protein B0G84_8209 [Paraburkholderia sp. BL8N3]|nr:hypothetical protein B0G84_8209 [Paraburkholderia sp. BL8N3]
MVLEVQQQREVRSGAQPAIARLARLAGIGTVPARIIWTPFCDSGGLFHGGCLTGFMG